MERSLVLLKPDAAARGLVGETISRLERKGLKLVGLKMIKPDREKLERLYLMHRGKPFYEGLLEFMAKGPLVAVVVEGPRAVSVVRAMLGATDSAQAQPGTIRGDLAMSVRQNVAHAADSSERAEEEIRLLFKDDEIIDWDHPLSDYIY